MSNFIPYSNGLTTLVTQEALNYTTNIRSVAYSYNTTYNTNDSKILLERHCDIILPEYLEFIMKNDYSLENFLFELKKTNLLFTLCGQYEVNIPISLLINLTKPVYCENKIYINTHFDIFFGNIPHVAIQYNTIEFSLSNYNNLSQFIEKYGIIHKYSYVATEERRNIARTDFKRVFQQLSYIEYDMRNIITDNNTYNFHINFCNLSKGFFIECNNIDSLYEIKVLFQEINDVRFYFNKFLIQTKCVKINENMIYFPFNSDKSYKDTTIESYEGGINFGRINNVQLILKFTKPINNIKIYNLGSKIFQKFQGTIEIGNFEDGRNFESSIVDYNN